MKLTGKAKKSFEEWYINQNYQLHLVNFYGLEDSMQFGVIQDWADSIGIDIIAETNINEGYRFTIYKDDNAIFRDEIFKTRQEARNAAIEKLNQIVNEG